MKLFIDAKHHWTAHFHVTEVDIHDEDGRTVRVCKVTHCTVHTGPCNRLTPPSPSICLIKGQLTGTTICGMFTPDQYVKATGRKIAFTRAIKSLPRNLRTALWVAYNTKVGIFPPTQPGASAPEGVPTNVGTVPINNPSPAA